MFKGIKLRIMKGRQLNPFATAKVLQEHEDRITALEGGDVTPTTYDLAFTINDGTDPVSGATVTVSDKTGTTDSIGECTIEGVEEGTVSVEVSKTGFVTKTESVSVDETHTSFTISLTEESNGEDPTSVYDLSFTVNDGTAPVSGATVTIGSKTGTTGSSGGCTIKDVEAGTVSVEVSKEGFTTKTESITVDETHTSFTISLTASSP